MKRGKKVLGSCEEKKVIAVSVRRKDSRAPSVEGGRRNAGDD